MQGVVSDHPPGTLALPTGDLLRFRQFMLSLLALRVPSGSQLIPVAGLSVADNLNRCVDVMRGEWFCVLADDHVFEPGLLLALLDRHVDVIAPLCSSRIPPFAPTVYDHYNPSKGTWPHLAWTDLWPDPHALLEVGAVGGAFLLIRKHVMDALGQPIFEIGRTSHRTLNEDLWFCKKAHDAGFKVYVDCAQRLGHTNPVTYYPQHRDGRWGVRADLGNEVSIDLIPQ